MVSESDLLHLVEIIGAPVVDIMQESSSDHGHDLQICVVSLQLPCLTPHIIKT